MKRILSILIAAVTGIVLNMSVFAEDYIQQNEDSLKIYMDELEIINEELGTNYRIPVDYFDNSELDEVVQLFTKMNMEEFRNYIYTAHFNYISEEENINNENSKATTEDPESMLTSNDFEEKKLVPTKIVETSKTDSASKTVTEDIYSSNSSYTPLTQRYYYKTNSTDNYLYIQTETFIINNIPRYNRYNFSGGYLIGNYPGYKATECSVSFSSNDTVAVVTYTCLNMISRGVDDGKEPFQISCTFYAGLGDIYAI